MLRTVLLLAAGLAAGLAVAVWFQEEPEPFGEDLTGADDVRRAGDFSAADASRLEMLEAALQAEIDERAALEQRVFELDAALDELRAAAPSASQAPERRSAARDGANAGGEAVSAAGPANVPPNARQRFRGGPNTPEREIERLVAAGFAPDRAAWIQQRTAELTLERMQAQYTARRDGQPMPANAANPEQTLRAELGEQDYERYLTATGRPTRIGVYNVLPGSPGERAGLKPGDEIVSYAGRRVYGVGELNELTFEGRPGESVVVDVVRDGQPLQLVVPRGPIGIGGGGIRRGP